MSADAMLKAVSAFCDVWAALFLMAFVKFHSYRNSLTLVMFPSEMICTIFPQTNIQNNITVIL